MRLSLWLATVLMLLISPFAAAHQQSQSLLRLNASAQSPETQVRLDLALVDLEHAIGLDDDADAQIRWGARAHESNPRQSGKGLVWRRPPDEPTPVRGVTGACRHTLGWQNAVPISTPVQRGGLTTVHYACCSIWMARAARSESTRAMEDGSRG